MTEDKPARKPKAIPGNKNGVKLKDADVRQQAFNSYCAHLAKGKSKRSWWFEHETLSCTCITMDKYIAENPTEFDPIKVEMAQTKGYYAWEEISEGSAKGENEANTASLQMVMRNKFGWDKKDKDDSEQTITIKHQYATSDGSP